MLCLVSLRCSPYRTNNRKRPQKSLSEPESHNSEITFVDPRAAGASDASGIIQRKHRFEARANLLDISRLALDIVSLCSGGCVLDRKAGICWASE